MFIFCASLTKDFPQFHHVSSGDLLRRHVRHETELGKKAKIYMEDGKLVPDDLMIGLVMHEATPHLDNGKSLLLDGFPRTVAQARALEEVVHVDMVINLDIPTETIVERIADRCVLCNGALLHFRHFAAHVVSFFFCRWIHEPSGRIYSYSYKPPKVKGKDDVTGEPLIQRKDDQPATVRARLRQYEDITSPLVEYYDQHGVVRTFHGTESDVIYPEVRRWLKTFFEES
jgi:nucleoside-triphosphate--adenylate kinase